MIVRCTSVRLSRKQLALVGQDFSDVQADQLAIGQQYVVLGLQFEVRSLLWGTGAWVQIPVDEGIVVAPLCLFEVIDGRVSDSWKLRHWDDGSVTLMPPSFYDEFYLEDLRAAKPEVLEDFRAVRASLEREAGAAPR